jgi:rhomboid protease GluP
MNQNNPPPQGTPPPSPYAGQPPGGRVQYHPYVTYVLIGICAVVYLVQIVTSNFPQYDITSALLKNNALIVQGQVWRLFTPIFLHGSILHIGINMYALFFIGRGLERFYGRWRYLSLFMLSGFAGNVLSFMFSPYLSLGSSTSIFGLLGAEGVLIYQNREIFGSIARRALSQVIIVAVANLVIDLTPGIGIDIWGHIGGLVGGTLFAWFGGPILRRQTLLSNLTLVDERTKREIYRAGIAVGALFVFLTTVVILIRRG